MVSSGTYRSGNVVEFVDRGAAVIPTLPTENPERENKKWLRPEHT